MAAPAKQRARLGPTKMRHDGLRPRSKVRWPRGQRSYGIPFASFLSCGTPRVIVMVYFPFEGHTSTLCNPGYFATLIRFWKKKAIFRWSRVDVQGTEA